MAARFLIVKVLLIAGISGFVAANSVPNPQECPVICPALYAPVCATDGKVHKEFSNACELAANNCRLERNAVQPFSKTDAAWCHTEYVEDLFEKLVTVDQQSTDCFKPCPYIYAPVCVVLAEYRTLVANECALDTYNCILKHSGFSQSFRVLQQGTC